MYAHLDGIIADIGVDTLVIDCNGVGYLLTVTADTLSYAPGVGQRMKVYTYLSVREDAMELFGFRTKEEKKMFERLRGVTGIGPKSAMAILSALGVQGLSIALAAGDAAAIARAPGVGKKTAQRLSLELKDKLAQDALGGTAGLEDFVITSSADAPAQDAVSEAMLALKSLGYTPQEAANALKGVKGQADTADELIRLALRHMAQNG